LHRWHFWRGLPLRYLCSPSSDRHMYPLLPGHLPQAAIDPLVSNLRPLRALAHPTSRQVHHSSLGSNLFPGLRQLCHRAPPDGPIQRSPQYDVLPRHRFHAGEGEAGAVLRPTMPRGRS
jgi:hypothetical protein